MRYGQLVIGPAGSGKSTYCSMLVRHCQTLGRSMDVVNLDPAAETFDYPVLVDVRELVSLDDVMDDKEVKFGPNGGLVFCMEYLVQNLDWLEKQIDDIEDDYILFDCPGQIELYTHIPVMRKLADFLRDRCNFHLCAVHLLDSTFILSPEKFASGVLAALSGMVSLELPHMNVLTKCDLLSKSDRRLIERFTEPNFQELLGHGFEAEEDEELAPSSSTQCTTHVPSDSTDASTSSHKFTDSTSRYARRWRKLNEVLGTILDDYAMVRFVCLDPQREWSVSDVLALVDNAIQYGEDKEPRARDYELGGGGGSVGCDGGEAEEDMEVPWPS